MKESLKQFRSQIDIDRVSGRAGSDTIRLWEGYKESAYLWRAIALLQFPVTFLSILAALIMYFFADTIIEVPQVPQPGYYSVSELPDSAFVDVAQEVVNLIATYQPDNIKNNWMVARNFLWEPALSAVQHFINTELPKFQETRISQLFMIIPNLTRVDRRDQTVTVSLKGKRIKYVAGQLQELGGSNGDELVYNVQMVTIPRNITNEYGIVVTRIWVENGKGTSAKGEIATPVVSK